MSKKGIPAPPAGYPHPIPDLEERILHEAEGVLVLNKPPRLPSTGRTLDDPDCLQFWLMQRARRMVWAVHQLDADTSGVNVFVRRKSLVPAWQERMRYPRSQKTYLAIVHGMPAWERLRCAEPIGFVERSGWRGQAVTPSGKRAATRFECLAQREGFSLLSATLESGRTHQIRVHLAHLGLSLVGEEWYRAPACTLHPRQALHAARIAFSEAAAGDPSAHLVAPLAPDLLDLATRLGLVDAARAWYDRRTTFDGTDP